jgi:hypothetical protein
LKKHLAALGLCASAALGADDSQLAPIQKQLSAMQESIRQMQTQHQQEIEALKQQLADQQALIESLKTTAAAAPPLPTGKGENGGLSLTPNVPPPSVAPPKSEFPTTDDAVVTSLIPTPAQVAATPNTGFPTTDDSVISSTSPPPGQPAIGASTIPTIDTSVVSGPTLGGPPISLGGSGKTYLNISLDVLINAAARHRCLRDSRAR